ncbi:MAG: threonine-phosphate decarboxylase CobD [Albidovulum sp.]
MRDHGGNIDWAMATFGGDPDQWIDLSTGINRVPYPIPPLPGHVWTDLPTKSAMAALTDAARKAYRTNAAVLPLAGAQAAIQMIPQLGAPGAARVLAPTYNEHAACLRAAGWVVEEVTTLDALAGADMAVVVNPNNPDGLTYAPDRLLALAAKVGRLVVDESFADPRPALSIAPNAGAKGLFVLRSFGKFYGLAGLRLGFVIGHASEIARLGEMAGPWPIAGPAIEIGRRALADKGWANATTARLQTETTRLDAMARAAGWRALGGTELFRLYDAKDAVAAQNRLAQSHIWTRVFPYAPGWVRLGLPGCEGEWARLAMALGQEA